jgi:hypothetical protein
LAEEELPEEYLLSDASADLGELTVAAQATAAANAASVVAGASNADDLTLAVTYTLADTLANLTAADTAVRSAAASYSLTDAAQRFNSVTEAQAAVITGASNAADYTFGLSGVSELLTTGTNSFVGTANDDTFTAANGTLQTADTILDSSTTDRDVLNATVSSATLAPRLQNIETLNITGRFTTTGLDLASTSGTIDLNVDNSLPGGSATIANASSLNALNINAGPNIGSLTVTATASGTRDTVFVDAGSATTVVVTGGEGADSFNVTIPTGANATFNGAGSVDAYTVNVGATATLTGNANTEAITINANAASVITLGGVLTSTVTAAPTAATTVTGTGDVEIRGTNARLTDTAIVNGGGGTLTVRVTDAAVAADLKAVSADRVVLAVDPTAGIVTVNEGSVVSLLAGGTTTLNIDNAAGTLVTGTLLVDVPQTITSLTTGAKVDTLVIQAAADQSTDTDADGNGVDEATLTVTTLVLGALNTTVVVTGDENLTIGTLTNGANAVIAATTMTGNLRINSTAAATSTIALGTGNNTVTVGNAASTIFGNSGNDSITGGTAADTIFGGDGNDVIAGGATAANTINAGAGNDTVTATAADTITLGAGSDEVRGAVDVGYTVTDFNVAEDRIVLTGAADSAVNLANVTPTAGAYTITGAGADFTLTGVSVTDLTPFVQLGRAGAPFITNGAAASTVVAGDLSDYISVPTTDVATITTGGGNDVVTIAVGALSAVTVTDFTIGSDRIILTGTATATTNIDLTSVTAPTAGLYVLGGATDANNANVTLTSGGTNFTTTDLSGIVQLGESATVRFTLNGVADVTGSRFNDFIDLGTAGSANIVNFIDNGGTDNISGLVVAEDSLSFDLITGITATAGTAVAANAARVADAVSGSVYVFADSGDGTGAAAISTFTVNAANGITAGVILADVAAFLDAGLASSAGERYIAVINDGAAPGTAYVYDVTASASGIEASGVSLIGIVTADAALTAAEIV